MHGTKLFLVMLQKNGDTLAHNYSLENYLIPLPGLLILSLVYSKRLLWDCSYGAFVTLIDIRSTVSSGMKQSIQLEEDKI